MFERGITTSKADVWAHVCPAGGEFFIYKRRKMVAALGQYDERILPSARGRLVPCRLWFIHRIVGPAALFSVTDWESASSDTDVGEAAEQCFQRAVDAFLIPPLYGWVFMADTRSQNAGIDYRIGTPRDLTVEVKADIPGGTNGTGNLFVQTHEGSRRDGDAHPATDRRKHRK